MCTNVEESSKYPSGVPSRRQKCLTYHLEIERLKQAEYKTMFLNTLTINEQFVLTALKRKGWG